MTKTSSPYIQEGIIVNRRTYKTTRRTAIIFLVVKSNVNYQIFATLVTESESAENTVKALPVINQWNPTCRRQYFMTNYSKEFSALEYVFPGRLFM